MIMTLLPSTYAFYHTISPPSVQVLSFPSAHSVLFNFAKLRSKWQFIIFHYHHTLTVSACNSLSRIQEQKKKKKGRKFRFRCEREKELIFILYAKEKINGIDNLAFLVAVVKVGELIYCA